MFYFHTRFLGTQTLRSYTYGRAAPRQKYFRRLVQAELVNYLIIGRPKYTTVFIPLHKVISNLLCHSTSMRLVMPNIVSLSIYLYFSVCVCLIGE